MNLKARSQQPKVNAGIKKKQRESEKDQKKGFQTSKKIFAFTFA